MPSPFSVYLSGVTTKTFLAYGRGTIGLSIAAITVLETKYVLSYHHPHFWAIKM
jgi:hypothetical protein